MSYSCGSAVHVCQVLSAEGLIIWLTIRRATAEDLILGLLAEVGSFRIYRACMHNPLDGVSTALCASPESLTAPGHATAQVDAIGRRRPRSRGLRGPSGGLARALHLAACAALALGAALAVAGARNRGGRRSRRR